MTAGRQRKKQHIRFSASHRKGLCTIGHQQYGFIDIHFVDDFNRRFQQFIHHDGCPAGGPGFHAIVAGSLHQAGGSDGTNPLPPPPDGGNVDATNAPAYTRDELTAMASQIWFFGQQAFRTDDKTGSQFRCGGYQQRWQDRRERSNGFRSSQFEFIDFIEYCNGCYHGRPNIEADIQSLIQQLSSSSSSDSSSSSTTSSSATSDLQQSFQNLISALGGSSSSVTLDSFLNALASNFQGATSSGNVVSEKV